MNAGNLIINDIQDIQTAANKNLNKTKSKNSDMFFNMISDIKDNDDDTIDNDIYIELFNLLSILNIKISDFIKDDKTLDVKAIVDKLVDIIEINNSEIAKTFNNLYSNKIRDFLHTKLTEDSNNIAGITDVESENKINKININEIKLLINKLRQYDISSSGKPANDLIPLISDKADNTELKNIKDDISNKSMLGKNVDNNQSKNGTDHFSQSIELETNKYVSIETGDKVKGVAANKNTKETPTNDNIKTKEKNDLKDVKDNVNLFIKIKDTAFNDIKVGSASKEFEKDILNQVTNGIKMTLNIENNKSSAEIKLKPEHLGYISLNLEMDKGIITAKFIVQNEQVKSVIEANLNQLYDSLKNQGYNVNDIIVSLDLSFNNNSTGYNDGRHQNRSFIKINNKDIEKTFDISLFKYDTSNINYLI